MNSIDKFKVNMSEKEPVSLVVYGPQTLVGTSLAGKKNQKKKQQLNPMEPKSSNRNEDYLNSILPPREYTEGGSLYVRYVSPKPATKVDVMNLQD